MSKGSNRRPGTNYAAGYDGIDWGRKDAAAILPVCNHGGLPGQILTIGPNGQRLWVTPTTKTCQHAVKNTTFLIGLSWLIYGALFFGYGDWDDGVQHVSMC